MTAMRPWQRLRVVAVMVLVGGTAWLGFNDAVHSLQGSTTAGQRVAVGMQLTYATAGVVAVVALVMRAWRLRAALIVWALAAAATGGLAPIVWGGTGVMEGAASGAASLLAVGVVAWGGWLHLRGGSRGGAAPAEGAARSELAK